MSKTKEISEFVDYSIYIQAQIQDGFINWIQLERKLHSLNNVDEMYYFVEQVIDILKVCDNIECKIHNEGYHLNYMRRDMKFKTLNDARTQLKEDKLELQKYEELFEKYLDKIDQIWHQLKAIKNSLEATEKRIDKWHERKIKMMEVGNDNNIPTDTQFTNEIQDGITSIEKEELALKDKLFEITKRKLMKQAGIKNGKSS